MWNVAVAASQKSSRHLTQLSFKLMDLISKLCGPRSLLPKHPLRTLGSRFRSRESIVRAHFVQTCTVRRPARDGLSALFL